MHVAWGILALLGLALVEGGIVAIFDPSLDSLAAKLIAQAMLAVTLGLVAFVFAAQPGPGLAPPRALGLRPFRPASLKWVAAAFFIYIAFAAAYSTLVHPDQEDVARELGFEESLFGAIASGILIIGLAPLSEEIFFRGFVYGGLRRTLPVWPAVIISGAIFGPFHFTGVDSLGVVPQLAVFGAILAWLYEKTGSLWPPILLHGINNTLAFIVITAG